MRFSKLIIRNFRSIDASGVEIEFPSERNLAVFVGANSSGKTNIIEALAIVLGVYPFSRYEPVVEDFHCKDDDNEMLIELHFDPPLAETDFFQKPYDIRAFRFRCWRAGKGSRKAERGLLKKDHYCLDENGKVITKARKLPKKQSASGAKFDPEVLPIFVSDQSWKVGDSYFLDAPSLERFFEKTTGYSPLGRLFDLYREDFDADHNTFSVKEGTVVSSREAFKRYAKRLSEILRTTKLEDIERELAQKVAEYFRADTDALSLQFTLPSPRELFDKLLALYMSDCAGVPALPAASLGAGVRALLRLAVLEALSTLTGDDQPLVLLIEEPEIYLHVHLRRYFSRVLRRLATQGHQIIFTTHSAEFLDLRNPHEVVRVTKSPNGATAVTQVPPDAKFDFDQAGRKIRSSGSEELFFAQHALLLEGPDDQRVFGDLLWKVADLDVAGVSLIDCRGAPGIPDHVTLCKHLGIDFYVIHDEDDPQAQERRNRRIAEAVAAADSSMPRLAVISPRLEEAMGEQAKVGGDVLSAKFEHLSFDEAVQAFPDALEGAKEFAITRRLVGPKPTEA